MINKESFKFLLEFWNEYKKVKYGLFGLIIIIIFIFMIIFEKYITDFPEAGKNWRNIEYWQNNPKNAKPVWVNWFSKEKYPESKNINQYEIEKNKTERSEIIDYTFEYNFNEDYFPEDIKINYEIKGKAILTFSILRPDGEEIRLFRKNNESSNYNKKSESIQNEAKQSVYNFLKKNKSDNEYNVDLLIPIDVIFSSLSEETLKGNYKIKIKAILLEKESSIENINIDISGKVFGIMGTDSFKRDIWSGIVSGMKWALFIGFMVSLVSVSVGVIYGITSAYFGGITDAVMQRIYEYFVNIPFLPILIVISAVFKPSIWTFIFLMSLLGWTGSVRTVRSIGLQIKEETFIEASKALGASDFRIIFTHMVPLLVPYSFASMALSVPAAILAEAGISIIGLGDSTIVTWGQMLQDAKSAGAVIQGMWWWILPPGIMITIVGMSFAFIGFSMDKILMPKLKTR